MENINVTNLTLQWLGRHLYGVGSISAKTHDETLVVSIFLD